MSPRPPNPVRVFGAAVILRHAAVIQAILQGGQIGVDLEAVHDLRVATRRLRTALSIFSPVLPAKRNILWQEEVARLTKALGAARDCDVQLDVVNGVLAGLPTIHERPGLRRLILRLSQKRALLQENVLASLEQFQQQRTLESFTEKLADDAQQFEPSINASPEVFQLAERSTHERLTDFLSYEPFIHLPECAAELHAMRIAAKRLRYCMETFSELSPALTLPVIQSLKKAQDLLGLIHDCDVWLDFLPRFVEKETARTLKYYGYTRPIKRLQPGLDYFHKDRLLTRAETYQAFVKQWDTWQVSGYWQHLPEIFSPVAGEPQAEEEIPDAL